MLGLDINKLIRLPFYLRTSRCQDSNNSNSYPMILDTFELKGDNEYPVIDEDLYNNELSFIEEEESEVLEEIKQGFISLD